MDTALHEVVRIVERSLEYKEYTLATFLTDVEGAFNNVLAEAIRVALTKLDLEEYIIKGIVFILRTRVIQGSMGNS